MAWIVDRYLRQPLGPYTYWGIKMCARTILRTLMTGSCSA